MSDPELEMKAWEHDVTPEAMAEVAGIAAEGVVKGYKKIETGVVEGYKKLENRIVEGFGKLTDKCVEVLFAKEGESVGEAKERLNRNAEKY